MSNKKRLFIKNVKKMIGKEVCLQGWVHTLRDLGKIKFFLLRDISGVIQLVFLKENKESFLASKKVTLESVLEIEGLVKESKKSPAGVEVEVKRLKILSLADPMLPIPVNDKTQQDVTSGKRMSWRFLDLRNPKKQLMFKVWTVFEQGMRDYFLQNGFIQVYTPKLMSSPSESGAELFEIPYFNRKAYLAQSPQFYKQMAMAAGFEKVFEVGPVFRAELSFTTRHATEFTGYDVEISFIKSHEEVMAVEEDLLISAITKVNEVYGDEIKRYYKRDIIVPKKPFPRLTMKNAKKILKMLKVKSEKVGDLSPEEEKAISQYIFEKEGHEFVFITDYPVAVRAFYHMRYSKNPKITKGFDLLWNGIEVTTGAQREHRYGILKQQTKEKLGSTKPVENYLNFFKYGCPPHGGFGMGPSRLIMKLLNIKNIREAIYLYRGVKRLTP